MNVELLLIMISTTQGAFISYWRDDLIEELPEAFCHSRK
jgi:hypothetical protein